MIMLAGKVQGDMPVIFHMLNVQLPQVYSHARTAAAGGPYRDAAKRSRSNIDKVCL